MMWAISAVLSQIQFWEAESSNNISFMLLFESSQEIILYQ